MKQNYYELGAIFGIKFYEIFMAKNGTILEFCLFVLLVYEITPVVFNYLVYYFISNYCLYSFFYFLF